VATDADIGYVVAQSDAYTFWGLEKTVKLLEDIKNIYAGEFRNELELYRTDLAITMKELSHPDGLIDRVILTNDKETQNWKEVERLASSASFAYTGVIDPGSEIFKHFI
jgi:hypothetical protein